MQYPLLSQASLQGKRVILRAGFDVPMDDGTVMDSSRIEALVPTIEFLRKGGNSVVILAHQGRPKGKRDPEFSQQPLVLVLEKLLGTSVLFSPELTGPNAEAMAKALKPGEVMLVENLRYDPREEANDVEFAKELAALGDVYVNDAFTNCHRAHASMVGIPALMPSFMGLQLEQEVTNLSRVLEDPRRPLTLIIGGAKMDTKIPVIRQFLALGDDILLGGAIANTFAAARGFDVGSSLVEPEQEATAQELMLESDKEDQATIHVLRDAVVASKAEENAKVLNVPLESVVGDMKIFDIGTATVQKYCEIIKKSGMIVWNGPVGMHEFACFAEGSQAIAKAIAEATKNGAVSIIGGGDTIDIHTRYSLDLGAYTFVSTGGGAMLELISGTQLPALEALKR